MGQRVGCKDGCGLILQIRNASVCAQGLKLCSVLKICGLFSNLLLLSR